MELDHYKSFHRLHHTFSLYTNIPLDQASKLLYADKVWRRTINFFDIKRGSWIQIRKILSDTTLITLEKTMYLLSGEGGWNKDVLGGKKSKN